ncbi:McrB family protein [Dialister sp.]|uniref:McrB family protein n=1 Tax=Dialister sp. TaxID=1955814 RepID=UPI002E8164BF|nr:restriction endonuclease [Dialister sp.]MEE3453572.1 restriction endonuclease [Dialister sp.]
MGNNYSSDSSFSALRQADGKVLGRVRLLVKGSTPTAGMKDYRFFVDALSPLPRGFEDSEKHGFTGFMSRVGFGFNSFANEEEALGRLQERMGNCFVTFTPAIRNNKYFVLDDLQIEGTTPFMDLDTGFYPVPAFGTVDQPAFDGDINKFCSHLILGKPLPGLSKKYWNNDVPAKMIIAATRNFEGRLGPWVVFAPLYDKAFDHAVIGQGGAYFRVRDGGPLGYGIVDERNSELFSHILCCGKLPLWFVPDEFLPDLRMNLKPVPPDGDLLKDSGVERNPFLEEEPLFIPPAEEKTEGSITAMDIDPIVESLASEEIEMPLSTEEEEILSQETEEKPSEEKVFLDRLSEAAAGSGLLYAKEDLLNFHISLKSSRLTILAGMSGTGKSGLVRLYGKALGLPEERVRFLAVRPSWMDDGDILGYVDTKNNIYRSADTGLSETLIDAAAHPDRLYLICFDEMNLARAEHYFAQFISVLEKEENPVIRLYNPALSGKLYNGDKYPAEIRVGRNVLFTGTVNVDESTYHFSDKILDRANVITLHQGRFHDLLALGPKEEINCPEMSASLWESFRKVDGLGLSETELDLLDELNDAFKKSGGASGIGFRIAAQMGRYLENIPEDAGFDRAQGIDAQIVQRVLTKLRGSSQQLEGLISIGEKGSLSGAIPEVLDRFSALSDFHESRETLAKKAGELKLYDYTI